MRQMRSRRIVDAFFSARDRHPRWVDGQDGMLRLDNETDWDTGDLRRIVLACCKAMGVGAARTVKLYRLASWLYPGRASIGRPELRIGLPADTRRPFNVKVFAQTLEHEIEHNLGLGHRNMGRWSHKLVFWAEGMRVRPRLGLRRAPRPQPTPEQVLVAKERRLTMIADSKVKEWTRKSRFARSKLTFWRRRLLALELRMAAKGGAR
jgi:hypothetical protein